MYTVILKKKIRTKLCIILLLFDFILLPSLHIFFLHRCKRENPEQAHRSTKVVTLVHNQPRKTRDKHNHIQTTEEDKDIIIKGKTKSQRGWQIKDGNKLLHNHD